MSNLDQSLGLGERRKLLGPNGWFTRPRTKQEVAHLNRTGEHHPDTYKLDLEALQYAKK